MNSFVNDCYFAEKNICGLTILEKSTSTRNNISVISLSNCADTKVSTIARRTPLAKAYSCSDTVSSNKNEQYSFITPTELLELISDDLYLQKQKTCTIIDCRSQIDFSSERIRSSYNINCRAKIVAKKLLSKCLDEVEPSLKTSLQSSDTVIIYDQSTDQRSREKLCLSSLNHIIQAARRCNKIVRIIQGGFDAVKTQYPHLIECAVYSMPIEDNEQNNIPSSPVSVDKENFTMTEILPHIFVGNVHDAQNIERLTQFNITHVINATPDLPCFCETKCQYLRFPVLDLPSTYIQKYFEKAFRFIDDVLLLKTNNILVHCSAGISRSPTIVLSYMIKKYHMTLEEAFLKMRQSRSIVDPNISFMLQLRDWEKTNLLTTTVKHESIEDDASLSCIITRSTVKNNYCGSTSKSKADKNALTESAIVVN